MLLAMALATAGTAVAFAEVVGHYRTAASQLQRALSLSAELTNALTAHESLSHTLWNGDEIDRGAYLSQEGEIRALFAAGLQELHGTGQHELLQQASSRWQDILVERGLFGPSAKPLPGVTLSMQQQFGQESDDVAGLMARLSSMAIADGSHDLKVADSLRLVVIALLITMLTLGLAILLYFARRMGIDVIRPLETLERAALQLREGDLATRVSLPARSNGNELGDLAATFNEMAAALQKTHHELSRQATHDALTGLPNRATFHRHLDQNLGQPDRPRETTVSVLFIDVDDFKLVNDSLGHAAGDALLAGVAERLAACVRSADVVARLGGDEFAILVTVDTPAGEWATTIATRIIDSLRTPITIAGEQISVAVSIGISGGHADSGDSKRLLAEADFAMYTAKRDGKGRHEMFDGLTRDDAALHLAAVAGEESSAD
jgi:diguanylate cyclase (GGDEF)-like protein